jgi:hypothetical protein
VVIVILKTSVGDEIRLQTPNFVTPQKNELLRPRQCLGPKSFPQSLGHNCTDFNTKKIIWCPLEILEKKNVFFQKCDEIRSFDGTK